MAIRVRGLFQCVPGSTFCFNDAVLEEDASQPEDEIDFVNHLHSQVGIGRLVVTRDGKRHDELPD